MSQASSAFASVKLPATLVAQAREAAQPMRRSVAGQVEYWATLGRIVEHSGLTAQEAQIAIARYEATLGKSGAESEATAQTDALLAQFMAVEANGSLAQRVREVVTQNRSKATTPST